MLPQQSTGLLRRKGATRFYMLIVGENSYFPPHPFSALLAFSRASARSNCAPARRVPHFVRRFRLTATRALPSTRKGDTSPLTPD